MHALKHIEELSAPEPQKNALPGVLQSWQQLQGTFPAEQVGSTPMPPTSDTDVLDDTVPFPELAVNIV
jgi:hypothetical protein